jgi:hypothetical protein
MNKKLNNTKKGLALALAVAALASCANNQSSSKTVVQNNTTDLIHCYDVNQCKGHNDCKTAENACAGHATCKGHGFVGMPTKACNDIGGKVSDEYKGNVKTADLIHCFDVNQCKGHNDCKTAENACAGHAACKGHGFVAMPAKSCTDVGGKKG